MNKSYESNLKYFNFYGGFNKKGTEYHILNKNTPLPWCNILANENFGTVISSYGTVYSYFKNSREYKISSWCNDWVEFAPGEKFSGIFENDYNLIYGFGYVKVLEEDDILKKTLDIFVPMDENLKIQYITLENKYGSDVTYDISYKINPVLGVSEEVDTSHIVSRLTSDGKVLEFKNPYSMCFSKVSNYIGVLNCKNDDIKYTINKDDFNVDVSVHVKAAGTVKFAIVLGSLEKSSNVNVDDILTKFDTEEKIEKSYKDTIKYWKNLVVKDFNTGDDMLDTMANGWLLYQTVVCRLYARSAFYQSGGALGYRDQLQDSLSLIRTWPERTRKQIVLHASKQFEKGDVLHWWHNHNNAGIRTYFSDDYLWLPYVLEEYVNITHDNSILDEMAPYLENKDMGSVRELYDVFNNIDVTDSVYGHAKKAILYGLSRISKKNGLLDIGDGDWNDGFSNIRGQSVWLTLFMINILDRFISLAKIKEDEEMIGICQKKRHLLKQAIITYAWEDNQFVRAFFENGDVLGSMKNDECKIDLISQCWAVIALKDDKDMKQELELALKSADKYLVDRQNKIVKLLYPAFDKPKNNPGYIKAYVPGIRENGGQYTHASIWLAKAYFELNKKEKAMEILSILNPINHALTKKEADNYMVEPYVIAADVYSNPEHLGRGGWTWYTGSASWMYKVVEDYLSNK